MLGQVGQKWTWSSDSSVRRVFRFRFPHSRTEYAIALLKMEPLVPPALEATFAKPVSASRSAAVGHVRAALEEVSRNSASDDVDIDAHIESFVAHIHPTWFPLFLHLIENHDEGVQKQRKPPRSSEVGTPRRHETSLNGNHDATKPTSGTPEGGQTRTAAGGSCSPDRLTVLLGCLTGCFSFSGGGANNPEGGGAEATSAASNTRRSRAFCEELVAAAYPTTLPQDAFARESQSLLLRLPDLLGRRGLRFGLVVGSWAAAVTDAVLSEGASDGGADTERSETLLLRRLLVRGGAEGLSSLMLARTMGIQAARKATAGHRAARREQSVVHILNQLRCAELWPLVLKEAFFPRALAPDPSWAHEESTDDTRRRLLLCGCVRVLLVSSSGSASVADSARMESIPRHESDFLFPFSPHVVDRIAAMNDVSGDWLFGVAAVAEGLRHRLVVASRCRDPYRIDVDESPAGTRGSSGGGDRIFAKLWAQVQEELLQHNQETQHAQSDISVDDLRRAAIEDNARPSSPLLPGFDAFLALVDFVFLRARAEGRLHALQETWVEQIFQIVPGRSTDERLEFLRCLAVSRLLSLLAAQRKSDIGKQSGQHDSLHCAGVMLSGLFASAAVLKAFLGGVEKRVQQVQGRWRRYGLMLAETLSLVAGVEASDSFGCLDYSDAVGASFRASRVVAEEVISRELSRSAGGGSARDVVEDEQEEHRGYALQVVVKQMRGATASTEDGDAEGADDGGRFSIAISVDALTVAKAFLQERSQTDSFVLNGIISAASNVDTPPNLNAPARATDSCGAGVKKVEGDPSLDDDVFSETSSVFWDADDRRLDDLGPVEDAGAVSPTTCASSHNNRLCFKKRKKHYTHLRDCVEDVDELIGQQSGASCPAVEGENHVDPHYLFDSILHIVEHDCSVVAGRVAGFLKKSLPFGRTRGLGNGGGDGGTSALGWNYEDDGAGGDCGAGPHSSPFVLAVRERPLDSDDVSCLGALSVGEKSSLCRTHDNPTPHSLYETEYLPEGSSALMAATLLQTPAPRGSLDNQPAPSTDSRYLVSKTTSEVQKAVRLALTGRLLDLDLCDSETLESKRLDILTAIPDNLPVLFEVLKDRLPHHGSDLLEVVVRKARLAQGFYEEAAHHGREGARPNRFAAVMWQSYFRPLLGLFEERCPRTISDKPDKDDDVPLLPQMERSFAPLSPLMHAAFLQVFALLLDASAPTDDVLRCARRCLEGCDFLHDDCVVRRGSLMVAMRISGICRAKLEYSGNGTARQLVASPEGGAGVVGRRSGVALLGGGSSRQNTCCGEGKDLLALPSIILPGREAGLDLRRVMRLADRRGLGEQLYGGLVAPGAIEGTSLSEFADLLLQLRGAAPRAGGFGVGGRCASSVVVGDHHDLGAGASSATGWTQNWAANLFVETARSDPDEMCRALAVEVLRALMEGAGC